MGKGSTLFLRRRNLESYLVTMTGMNLELISFKKETVDSSGSRVQRKNKNGPDVIQERLWHGKRIFLEEEIAVNVNRRKEEQAMTYFSLDSGVLEIPSNQKPVLLLIPVSMVNKIDMKQA